LAKWLSIIEKVLNRLAGSWRDTDMVGDLLCVFTAVCLVSCSQQPGAPEVSDVTSPKGGRAAAGSEIRWSDLNDRPVIGRLGVPMGRAVEIDATIVAGRELGDKASDGTYLLRVNEVERKAIEPVVIPFYVQSWGDAKLASNEFDLYKLKKGKKAGSLNEDQIKEIERGYVGKRVTLAVYEVGQFSGIPGNLPKDAAIWQDHGYCFQTELVVMRER
jgi:hypothetical protein